MTKYAIDETTLKNLANAIRRINGETKAYTPDEMIERVTNILDSVTYILVDETGNQIPALYTEGALSLTATPNDIRIGTTAVTDAGITEGALSLTATPNYRTSEGYKIITNGSKFILPILDYDYTKLQAIFCPYNTSFANSVAAEKVAIDGKVYPVRSTAAETNISLNDDVGYVDFGITNTSGKLYLIRYFTYKEVY